MSNFKKKDIKNFEKGIKKNREILKKLGKEHLLKSPRNHFDEWYDKFKKDYEVLVKDQNPIRVFTIMVDLKNEVISKLDDLAKEINSFGKRLNNILISEDKLEKGSEIFSLHFEIELESIQTFSSDTFGNFLIGDGDRDYLKKKLIKYFDGTDRQKDGGLLRQIDLAYRKRYIADKLQYQKLALEFLIERLFENDFPKDILELEEEGEAIEQFLAQKESSPGKSTKSEYFRNVYEIIEEILQKKANIQNLKEKEQKDVKDIFTREGRFIAKKAAEYALRKETFCDKWGEEVEKGYSFGWHEKKFKEIYDELFKYGS